MLKKISLVLVMLFAIVAFSVPASAELPWEYSEEAHGNAFLAQGQFGVGILMTGFVINPIDIGYSEYEGCEDCGCGMDAGLYWGGMSIDILAIQATGQGQIMGSDGEGFAMGCQKINNEYLLEGPGLTLKMSQSASQFGIVHSSGYSYSETWDD